MSDTSFHKRTSGILATGIIGIIVVSFMFSGYEGMRGAPDTVAKVDGRPISVREYQSEFERQLQFYSQMFGGNPLTQAQIDQFNIKDGTLTNLINRKLVQVFADRLGILASSDQVKKEIKELPYFKTNNQFDIERYKLILTNARLTPTEFEEEISEQVKGQLAQASMKDFPVSKKLLEEIKNFKAQKRLATLIQFRKNSLKDTLPVSQTEIEEFIKKKEGMDKIESLFKARKPSLDRPEEVRARHILLTTDGKNDEEIAKKIAEIKKEVTPSNFKDMAIKYSQDPESKAKGGDLGLFGKGVMMPEFEQVAFKLSPGQISDPVKTSYGQHLIFVEERRFAKEATLDEYKEALARELVRDSKEKELAVAVNNLKAKLETLLNQGKIEEISKLPEASKITIEKNITLNRFDGATGNIGLDHKILQEIFSKENFFKVDELPGTITLIKTQNAPNTEGEKQDESKQLNRDEEFKLSLARTLNQEILQYLNTSVSIKKYNILN